MSRPARTGTAGKPVTFRADPAEIAEWTLIAEREKCESLSAWIVKTLNKRAAVMRARSGR